MYIYNFFFQKQSEACFFSATSTGILMRMYLPIFLKFGFLCGCEEIDVNFYYFDDDILSIIVQNISNQNDCPYFGEDIKSELSNYASITN